MKFIQIQAYLSSFLASNLQKSVGEKDRFFSTILSLFIDFFAFFSAFVLLYEAYKQDVERTKISLESPTDVTFCDTIWAKEETRNYSFYTCIIISTSPWLIRNVIWLLSYLYRRFIY